MMEYNARAAWIWLLLLAFGIALTACGSQEGETASTPVVSFWHFWSEPGHKRALQEVVAEFEASHNRKVELTDLSWADGKQKLLAAFNSQTAPDVLELGSDWVAQFSGGGVLRNLAQDSIDLNSFVEFTHPPCIMDGGIYAIPWLTDTRVMFFNRDALAKAGYKEELPTNTAELLAMCRQVQEETGLDGFGANGPDRNRLYKKVLPFFWSNGGDIFAADGSLVLNSPQNVEALETYLALAQTGKIETQRQLDSDFIRGGIAFWISGSWLLKKIAAENANLNFGTMLIPAPQGRESASFAGGEYLAVNAAARNKELALKFVRFMSSGPHALAFCKKVDAAGFPADKQYFNDPYFSDVPHRATFAEQLKYARMTPVHPRWLDIQEGFEQAVEEALYSRKTAREALDDLQHSLAEQLQVPQ